MHKERCTHRALKHTIIRSFINAINAINRYVRTIWCICLLMLLLLLLLFSIFFVLLSKSLFYFFFLFKKFSRVHWDHVNESGWLVYIQQPGENQSKIYSSIYFHIHKFHATIDIHPCTKISRHFQLLLIRMMIRNTWFSPRHKHTLA